ncbi:inorganic phosphate transporter [Aspergillus lucknowensis]|uniref:Phosphate transporter family-domain-containing protein n=1 Tax=Aspergillus lucknowensis TaxID=176173 RepID=A0ABR4LI63_9EURO
MAPTTSATPSAPGSSSTPPGRTGRPSESEADVPVWQLAMLAIIIMKVMGNKIAYHSPSRDCSMELGAEITVLIISQYKLPVSTSMCITGAMIGVGLCNGTIKAVNPQRVGPPPFGWIMMIPIAGTLAGCLMGLFLNAPHFA